MRFLLVMLLILTDYAVAQNKGGTGRTAGQVTGQVLDQKTGKPLVGVNIIVQRTSLGAATDSDGRFIIQKIPPGTYSIAASMIGYHQETRDSML